MICVDLLGINPVVPGLISIVITKFMRKATILEIILRAAFIRDRSIGFTIKGIFVRVRDQYYQGGDVSV